MILMPPHIFERLLANGQESQTMDCDHVPVVKFFDPCGAGTWLITEVDPDDHDLLFGLCDLGFPELGTVRLSELRSVRNRLGLGLERDYWFHARYRISVYALAARSAQRICEDDTALAQAAAALAQSPITDSQISPRNGE